MTLIAAIDIGTTSLRVGLFDGEGHRRATVAEPLISQFPLPGHVEHDAERMVSTCVDLLVAACQEIKVATTAVDSIGVACQRATFVAWDAANGAPITPAIGWQDARTQTQVDELRAGGTPVNTMASCTKFHWVLNEVPEAKRAMAAGNLRLGTLDTWLTWKLTERSAFITDPSNASATGLYDPGGKGWNAGALDFFGIDQSILPEIVVTAEQSPSPMLRWPGADAAVCARVGDQQSACFAHGLVEGEAKLTLGTSAMLDVGIGEAPVVGPPGAHALPLWRLPSADDDTVVEPYCLEANIATAGGLVEWLVRVGLLPSVEDLDEVAGHGRPGPTMVPSLAGLGTPHDHSAARGLFGGIGQDTTAADLVLSAVDGIALRSAEMCDALDVGETLKVDGGLTRSNVLLQRLADLTGRTVLPAADPEVTLRGVAMLAAVSSDHPLPGVAYANPITPSISSDERAGTRARFSATIQAALGLG